MTELEQWKADAIELRTRLYESEARLAGALKVCNEEGRQETKAQDEIVWQLRTELEDATAKIADVADSRDKFRRSVSGLQRERDKALAELKSMTVDRDEWQRYCYAARVERNKTLLELESMTEARDIHQANVDEARAELKSMTAQRDGLREELKTTTVAEERDAVLAELGVANTAADQWRAELKAMTAERDNAVESAAHLKERRNDTWKRWVAAGNELEALKQKLLELGGGE